MNRLALVTSVLLPALALGNALSPQEAEPRLAAAGEAAAQAQRTNVSLPRMPSISPDGRNVVFSWRGDLWSVPTAGGHAVRISSHPADESWSRFSPDCARIAFNSERRGSAGLFTMNADGTGVTELLAFDRGVTLSDWAATPDGERLSFSASLEPDIYRSPRPYWIPAGGGVYERVHGAFGRSPAHEPGGERVLFERGGSSWSRRHYRGDTRDIWLYDPDAQDQFVRLTTWAGNDGRPRWAGKDKLIFTSDREDNTVNLYQMDLKDGDNAERNAKRLTQYRDRDVEDFDVTPDGSVLVYARWDRLYTMELGEQTSGPRELLMTAAEDERDNVEYISVDSRVTDAAVSPDGKTMAFIAYGQLYVRGTEDNSATRRISSSLARHKDLAWSPDGGTLYFASDESGRDTIYAVTATRTRSEIVRNERKY
jgi:tricorn protease